MHEIKQKWEPTQTIAKPKYNSLDESKKIKENALLK